MFPKIAATGSNERVRSREESESDRKRRTQQRTQQKDISTMEQKLKELKLETARRLEELAEKENVANNDRALATLDSLNPGNATKNFHGVNQTARLFGLPATTLRDRFIAHREKPSLESEIAPSKSVRPIEELLDLCINDKSQKASVVYRNNPQIHSIISRAS